MSIVWEVVYIKSLRICDWICFVADDNLIRCSLDKKLTELGDKKKDMDGKFLELVNFLKRISGKWEKNILKKILEVWNRKFIYL